MKKQPSSFSTCLSACLSLGLSLVLQPARSRRGGVPSLHRCIAAVWRRGAMALLLVLAAVAFAAPARAAVLVSNLGQSSGGSGGVGAFDKAQAFTTGANTGGYTLTSVELKFGAIGVLTNVYTVSIWSSNSSGRPNSLVGTLTNPASLVVDSSNTFTASGSGINLSASTPYLVVVDGNGGSALVENVNSAASANAEDATSATGWSIADDSLFRGVFSTGVWTSFNESMYIQVNGAAKTTTVTAPGAPTNFAATAGDAAVTLSWAAPASDGGAAITEYEYRYSTGSTVSSSATWTDVTDGSDSGTSTADETGVTLSSLTNGTEYAFEVRAVNSAGEGTAADPQTATPVADDDTAGVTISISALTVAEGGSDTYTVVLTSQPTGEVTVTPSVTGDSDVTVSAALTFTTSNWNTAQTLTVSAAEDADSADDSATIAHAVAGADYASVIAAAVGVTVTDNDSADSTAPRVASIVRQVPTTSPTNADSLIWRVTFSEAVQAVDAADFALSGSTATLAVAAVSASEYTVTASGGNLAGLDGTVSLSFAAGQNIQDLAGNALANTTPTGENNADYTLDNTAPTLVISGVPATSTAPFTATFTFSGAVEGFILSDIMLGNATASAFTATSLTVYTALITPTATGVVTVDVAAGAATDAMGNVTPAATQVSSTYTAPTLPVITISAGATPVTEGTAAAFTLSRTGVTTAALTVGVNVTETGEMVATANKGTQSVTFETGSASATLSVATLGDTTGENDSVVTATVAADTANPATYTPDTPTLAAVTVSDDDGGLPALSITASSPSVTEGTDAVFVVRSSASVSSDIDVTVQIQASPASLLTMPGGLSLSGTAGTRVDIGPVRILLGQSEATIRIPSGPVLQTVLGGVVSQGYLTATLVKTPAYGVETPGFAEVRLDAMVDPADELPVVSLALQDTASAVTEGDTIEFVVSRPAPPAPLQVDDLLALEVNVRYHLSTDGVNDPVVDTVTLEAGTLEKIVTISIPDNEVVDPGRVLTIALVSGTGYTISDTAASAAVTIIDDDGFVVEFVQSTLTLEEDVDSRSNSLPIEVRISGPRQPGPREFILFDIKTVAGTATEADYRPLNFPNGVSAQRFEFSQGSDGVWTAIQTYQMTSIADRVDELDEQFTVVLSRVRAFPSTFADVSLGATTRVTVTIADNDEPNTAPTAADGTVTTGEDTAYTFRAGDFNFADTDTGHVLESVRVVSLPTAGALTLDGAAVTAGQAIATGDLGDLAFTPAADANGAAYANFTFRVSDGIEYSAAANTITIAVTAVNDAPTGRPTVAGTAQVGETLSALVSEIADADGLSGASFTYQWWRVDADGSSNPVEITGETGTTYVLTTADIGKRIQVAVRYSDDDGTAEGPLSSAAWPSSGTVTAVVLPTITIASDTTPVTEGTAARFTLSRTGATTDALTVSVSVTESGAVVAVAEEGTKSVTFEIGEATAALSVATVDDRIDAADSVVTATVADDSADPATYTPGSPASATVTVADDDSAGVTVSESALTVAEGTTGTYTMVLTSQPTGEVTVTPSSDNREVTLSPATLSFTATNWNNAQMVTVSAAEDADSADDSATIAHSVAGADYALVTAANVAVTVTDNDDEIVANHPATGAPVIEGALTMASVLTADTSQIRDADGLDGVVYQYQWLRIDGAGNGRGEREIAGATEGTYRISEQDIGHRLRLRVAFADARGNPEQLYSAPTAAVSVVSREVAQAWLGRFGRTVSEQVLTVVDGRLHSSREAGSSLRLAGHELAQESGDKAGYKPDDGWGWRVRDEAEEGLYGAYGGRGVSGREWLTGSSFNVTSGSEAGNHMAFWGGVAANRFSGQQDAVAIEGEVISGQMGADWRRRWGTAGLLLSHARGEGDYRVDDDSGEIESTLTGVYPFIGYTLNDRTSLWGVAGYGSGESRYRSADGGGWYTSDLSLSLAAAGIRTVVRPTVAGSGLELSLVADGLLLRAESDASLGIAAESARVNRVRTGVEGRWHGLGSGLTPVLELGLRHDGGDVEKGFGADLGGGVDWHRGRFELQVRGRGLLTHEDSAFRNRGFSGMMSWQSQPSSSYGLKLRMQQSVGGSATGGVAALHGRETMAGLDVSGSSQESPLSSRTEMSVAYGMPFGRYFIGTPEVGLGITDQQQDYRVGWRLDLRRNREIDFALGLEVRRRENLETEDAGYEATLQLRANW